MPGIINTAIDPLKAQVMNPDLTVSTERTISVELEGKHYLIPTIVRGYQFYPDTAVFLFQRGFNPAVGVFDSQEDADAAAAGRSQQIGNALMMRQELQNAE